MSSRVLRCAGCARRIRGAQPYIGLIDYQSGKEITYHAHPKCQKRGAEEMASLIEKGRLYVLRHYHSSRCRDEAPGFDCSGGCFSGAPEAVAN